MAKRQIFKTSLLVLMAFAVSAFCFSKEKDEVITSDWASTPPNIDGLSQDWQGVPLVSQKYGVELGFMNDKKYFYALFVFTNLKYLSTVELTGMTLYFNTQGEKEKKNGINLRKIQLTADQFIAWMEKNKGPMGAAGSRARDENADSDVTGEAADPQCVRGMGWEDRPDTGWLLPGPF